MDQGSRVAPLGTTRHSDIYLHSHDGSNSFYHPEEKLHRSQNSSIKYERLQLFQDSFVLCAHNYILELVLYTAWAWIQPEADTN